MCNCITNAYTTIYQALLNAITIINATIGQLVTAYVLIREFCFFIDNTKSTAKCGAIGCTGS
jgi:hypothetical protein